MLPQFGEKYTSLGGGLYPKIGPKLALKITEHYSSSMPRNFNPHEGTSDMDSNP